MMTDSFDIPSYKSADPELIFLASTKQIYDYGNLYAFCQWLTDSLKKYEITREHPLLIEAGLNESTVFLIAACWYLRIPFIPIAPDKNPEDIDTIKSQFECPIVFLSSDKDKLFPKTDRLEIPHDVLRNHQPTPPGQPDSNPEMIFGYLQTSGSTSTPKVVPLKRRQMLFAASASEVNIKPDKDRFWLLCLPLHHIGGISVILRSLLYNSAIYLMNQFDTDTVSFYLTENRLFQAASLVPTMLKRLISHSGFHLHVEFKAIIVGGGPMSNTLIQECTSRGIPAISSYGMTETCAQIAANPLLAPRGIYHPQKSVGYLFKPNKIQIRNDDGYVLPLNESGLIWLRGPQIFDGYINKNQNKEAFDEEGWFKTGDYGHLNRSNQLFIESRRKDLIITGGENVAPREIEQALEDLDSVHEACVIGIDDEEWGQRVVAFITSDSDPVNTEELRKKLKNRLATFKIPKKIILIPSMPRTDSGKIVRKDLLKFYHDSDTG